MAPGKRDSRSTSIPQLSMCIAIACGSMLIAPGLSAEDRSAERPTTDSRFELLQSIQSKTSETEKLQDGEVSKAFDQPRPTIGDLNTAASGLNDVLTRARSKLDDLRKAADMAAIAATLREELEAGADENNRLAAALTEAEAAQRSLEASLEKSGIRIGGLSKALGSARSEANDLDLQLRRSREETAATDADRVAAVDRADRAESQLKDSRGQNQALSRENKALKDKLKATRLERDSATTETDTIREERNAAQQELDAVRRRIAGLLRSVLHADVSADTAAEQKGGAESSQAGAILTSTAAAATNEGDESSDRIYKIVQTSNIRSAPHRDAARVDIGAAGEQVSVLREAADGKWFEVKTKRGATGFIFGELIEPDSE